MFYCFLLDALRRPARDVHLGGFGRLLGSFWSPWDLHLRSEGDLVGAFGAIDFPLDFHGNLGAGREWGGEGAKPPHEKASRHCLGILGNFFPRFWVLGLFLILYGIFWVWEWSKNAPGGHTIHSDRISARNLNPRPISAKFP